MSRIYNFSPGPAVLPKSVLEKAREELLDYRNTGISVMEMSHRSRSFMDIMERAEGSLRKLLSIPDTYHVLFLQGGATSQFAMVPLNLFRQYRRAEYLDTGSFAGKAIAEASRYGEVVTVASSRDSKYSYIPDIPESSDARDVDYRHFTMNNTIFGTRFVRFPKRKDTPLVSDVSSCFLSEPLNINDFGLIYAGAQKNLGPAGLTVVIIRNDLVGEPLKQTPIMYDYRIHVDNGSLYNTPPCFSIYIAGLVLEWIENIGGLQAMAEKNRKKSKYLYDFIDHSSLFSGTAREIDRSMMNITFLLPSQELTDRFIAEAEKQDLHYLKGHRSAGGLRVSLYNAMPFDGVKKLVEFMAEFEKSVH